MKRSNEARNFLSNCGKLKLSIFQSLCAQVVVAEARPRVSTVFTKKGIVSLNESQEENLSLMFPCKMEKKRNFNFWLSF